MNRAVAALALSVSLVVLPGCDGPTPPPDEPPRSTTVPTSSATPSEGPPATLVGGFPIKTMSPEAAATDRPCPAALITGILAEHPVMGLGLQTDDLIVVVWPFGWGGIAGPPISLVDGDGAVVATVGQELSIGGGFVGDGQWLGCGGVTVLG
jgi:hypothetical protein